MRAEIVDVSPGVVRVSWPQHDAAGAPTQDFHSCLGEVTEAIESAFKGGARRVEAHVDPEDATSQRVATFAGLRREGVARGVSTTDSGPADAADRIVYARLVDDLPLDDPRSFRSLLNSFLPRKRAISQMLIRDPDDRVLTCTLTYKRDHDLPGGVVEVGESPQIAVAREVEEELGLAITAGELLLTDWLPAWSGWDDAVCLVFDGGVVPTEVIETVVRQEREIRSAQFETIEEIRASAADFTARRIEAALRRARGRGAAYTESGRG